MIVAALNKGHAGAQRKVDLAHRLGISTRDVEHAVQEARLAGAPICSNEDGYWLAESAQELAECSRRLRSRFIHQALTARALRKTAARMAAAELQFEQEPLAFGWDAA